MVEQFLASRLRFRGALCATAIGVSFFIMIVAVAVSAGFRHEIRSGIADISGDILLSGSSEPVDSSISYLGVLAGEKGVESITPVIWKGGVVRSGGEISGILFKGVPGGGSLQARIPQSLASSLGFSVGDRMTAYFIDERVKARNFNVSEITASPLQVEELPIVEVSIDDLRRVCGWSEGSASAFEVRCTPEYEDPVRLEELSGRLYAKSLELHRDDEDILRAQTVRSRYRRIFDWLDLIDFNVFTIIFLMTVVAGFNMISGLLILLFRNISTIGTMKVMGMTDRSVAKVFIRVAARLALTGMAAGNAAALLFCLVQNSAHLIRLNPANYFVSFVPVRLSAASVIATDVVSFAAILVMMLIPTLFITKIDPARTVRVR